MLLSRFWKEETGAILSAELTLIITLVVIGTVVGLGKLRVAVNSELVDLANAIGSLNQSFTVPALDICSCNAFQAGSGFLDEPDECDCDTLDLCGQVKDHNGRLTKDDVQESQG
jgi:Flp pilus assembly pilin Flp